MYLRMLMCFNAALEAVRDERDFGNAITQTRACKRNASLLVWSRPFVLSVSTCRHKQDTKSLTCCLHLPLKCNHTLGLHRFSTCRHKQGTKSRAWR